MDLADLAEFLGTFWILFVHFWTGWVWGKAVGHPQVLRPGASQDGRSEPSAVPWLQEPKKKDNFFRGKRITLKISIAVSRGSSCRDRSRTFFVLFVLFLSFFHDFLPYAICFDLLSIFHGQVIAPTEQPGLVTGA